MLNKYFFVYFLFSIIINKVLMENIIILKNVLLREHESFHRIFIFKALAAVEVYIVNIYKLIYVI